MPKFGSTPTLLILLFLYMFCSVLCFAVEDFLMADTSGMILLFKSYWLCFSFMIVLSLAIFIYEITTKNQVFDDENNNSLILNFSISAISLVVIIHISIILHKFFTKTNAGIPEILLIIINIFAISAFLLWKKLIDSNIKQKNFKKYFSILCMSIIPMLIIVFCLANRFGSKELIHGLNADSSTYTSVYSSSSALKNTKKAYDNKDELTDNIKKSDDSKLNENKI